MHAQISLHVDADQCRNILLCGWIVYRERERDALLDDRMLSPLSPQISSSTKASNEKEIRQKILRNRSHIILKY